jgi:hypothetical protein
MYDPERQTPTDRATTVRFDGLKPPGTYVEIPLTALPPGWTAKPPTFTIVPARRYSVFAGVTGNDYTTQDVTFTLEQLRPQGAARILAWVGTAASPFGDGVKLLTVPQFEQLPHRLRFC